MDLRTTYLGLELNSPIVVSASPLSENVENIKLMEEKGAGAVVLYSLFEEQLRQDQLLADYHDNLGEGLSAESGSFFPTPDEYRTGPEEYLELIKNAKAAVKIPIIASLNGSTRGGWISYAKKMQEAGADALELNIYDIPTNLDESADKVEERYIEVVKAVKSEVSIPVAVKLSPFFSNMANMARKLKEAGADGLVMFNRFYQPGIDLENLEIVPNLMLSHSSASRLPMRWIAILKDRIDVSYAATSGIHTGEDVAKMLLVGANATMVCSALLKNGIGHIAEMKDQLENWMKEKEHKSISDFSASMTQAKIEDPGKFERAQYMKALTGYKV